MLDDELRRRGVRDACRISYVMPLPRPVPPSPETSDALEGEFERRGIEFLGGRRVASLDPERKVVSLDGGEEIAFDLFLGVPKHRAPDVVLASGLAEDGYVPVDFATLATRFPGVYAVGDVATAGVPKAGVFAEGAARVVAQALIAELGGGEPPGRHLGQGTCYVEFGEGRIGSVDIDFLSGPEKTGTFNPPSPEQMALKERFGSDRRSRWFGL
jgi:sulfide:quinone oxidoreductase